MTAVASPGELIPISSRLRWMLLLRIAMAAVIPAGLLVRRVDQGALYTALWLAVGWLVLTVPTLVTPRINRTSSIVAFNLSLLGDGLLLCIVWRALGDMDGPGGNLVWLHCAAVTLLASFRTGVKLAVWHGLLALVSLEAKAAGLWGPTPRNYHLPFNQLLVYEVTLLLMVLAIAAFAAVNERELRRRRFDSDVLRRFAFDLAGDHTVDEIGGKLVDFASRELLATRTLVLSYRRHPETGAYGDGLAVRQIAGKPAEPLVVPDGVSSRSVVSRAVASGRTQLITRLEPAVDAWLTEQLPDAANLIVVPFDLDQIAGALLLEAPRMRIGRVEQRVQDATEQATALAAMALGRAVRLFDTRLAREVARARSSGDPVSLLMVDLDHFKRLNDRYGHQTGDEVLRRTARVLSECAVDGSLAARYGGEEFAVILLGAAAHPHSATVVAENIREGLRRADTPVPVTASLGLAVVDESIADAEGLVRAADAALYEAKSRGRDRVEVAGVTSQVAV
jgi:two-component system, cell cycle response regulator